MCREFFFSSRRRHTRYWRDWSSDVCSSDLAAGKVFVRDAWLDLASDTFGQLARGQQPSGAFLATSGTVHPELVWYHELAIRSEERRVGKACRSRWSPYH